MERARRPIVAALTYRVEVSSIATVLGREFPILGAELTAREQDVLAMVATGATNRQIANRLNISERTVRKHVQDIHVRLHVTNRVAAAAAWWAIGHRMKRSNLPSSLDFAARE